ncbi:MAG: chorismate mutase [Candidatus Dojkabacteria bacterium]|nr:chorismate mutase [Candidatus Dojkabacteria bacterium]
MTQEEKLKQLRDSIDLLDNMSVCWVAERLNAASRAWDTKQDAGMPSHAPGRWEEVLKSKKDLAAKVGVDKELISDLMNTIHDFILKTTRR